MMKISRLEDRRGLTLIELVAVLAIVAILAGIAVTSYRSYLVRARLQDAKVALETVRAEEEQYRAEFGHYCAPNTLTFFGGANQVDVEDYRITFNVTAPTSFTAQATPLTSRQSFANNQKYGGWITIDQDGNKSHQSGLNRWP
jgi:type IV pilus assembly protein PilE